MKNKPNIIEITTYLINFINSGSLLIFMILLLVSNLFLNIYVDIYIIMFLLILCIINMITINKYLKNYKEYTSTKIEITSNDSRYLEYFEKNYIRSKCFSIIYIVIFIVSLLFMMFTISKGRIFTISSIIIMILMITLFIRKVLLRKNYKRINTTTKNIKEQPISKKNIIIKTTLRSILNVIVITSIYGFYNNAWYASWLIVLASIIVIILKILINNPCNEFYMIKKKRVTTKVLNLLLFISVVAGIIASFIIAPPFLMDYIYNVKEVEHKEYKIEFADNKYKIYKNDTSDFKILQLSDIHIGGSYTTMNKDIKAMNAIKALVNETKPDFIIIMGDLVYPIAVQTFT